MCRVFIVIVGFLDDDNDEFVLEVVNLRQRSLYNRNHSASGIRTTKRLTHIIVKTKGESK